MDATPATVPGAIDGADEGVQFTCDCPEGFGGATCEIDLNGCGGDVCVSGTCQTLTGNPFRRFNCVCETSAVVGAYCQYDTSLCSINSSVCAHAGSLGTTLPDLAADEICLSVASDGTTCSGAGSVVGIAYRYPSCVVAATTTVSACDAAWSISMADVEVGSLVHNTVCSFVVHEPVCHDVIRIQCDTLLVFLFCS